MKNILFINSKGETLSLDEVKERKITSITISYTAFKKELYTGILSFLNLFSVKRILTEKAILEIEGVILLKLKTKVKGSIYFSLKNNSFYSKVHEFYDKDTLFIDYRKNPDLEIEIDFLLENIVQIDWT